MIRTILFFALTAVVFCQYPEQRAPPLRYRAPVEEYEEEYPPPQRQEPPPPQHIHRPSIRPAVVHKPADVHYVNIGLELAGDYKFGYDTGKGNDGQSFREETRLPDGTVQGAYGYVDETGRQRIVKYTAGKEGFKVIGDSGSDSPPQPAPRAAPAPQQAYRPPPQAYSPPQQQPAPRPQPQQTYRPPPPAQPAYRPPPQQPQPRPVYRPPPPEPAYAPETQYQPRPRPQAPRPAPKPVETYEEPDYDYNDITERRLVPVDTSLFSYNIGTSQDRKS